MRHLSLAEYERRGGTFIVAEVAQAHDGSLGILHSLIDACATTGVDAIKFQMHIAEAESSLEEPFRKKFSYVDATRFDYWKRMSFMPEQWAEIRRHCESVGLEFLVTPFSNMAVDLLERIGVTRYKVGSGDIDNTLLLERIRLTGKEVILSTGLATKSEICTAVEPFRPQGVAVLQCTTMYPTPPEAVGLSALNELRNLLHCPIGLSDHSGTIFPGVAAAALGSSMLEAHVTFDRRMFGPDAGASLTISDFEQLVAGIRFIEKARQGVAGKTLTDDVKDLKRIFGRSLAVASDLPAGHVLTLNDLEGKKPAGRGISMDRLGSVLGRALARSKARFEFLHETDIQ